ncbi:alpha/beta-hydrolase [Sphaerulina musiva SO2202]|uniref:Alpha/beta-hydrolase n=1 Tax=Sphaerulina musiva (strain SO2202) TaxID=692275 RepID=N1QEU8_SPHMS|nr:alpha/beta-hydrolase [Sphaerulina musiva SO2202]EMF11683.1 alpha/beta-hydrolase [Sphaerulina musiva SO2202]
MASITSSSSGRSSSAAANVVLPYRMHVSQRYLDLTRKKLDLTRLPREPRSRQAAPWGFGVAKTDLEPIIDHWTEEYDWRTREAHYNDTLPQYRVVIQGIRLHYVHKRSMSPNAMPIIFCHGFPESFIGISHMMEGLTNPLSTPTTGSENLPSFHVVVPSIPGFGFSDMVAEEGNNIASTAELFDALMKSLGYPRYIATGSGWGLNICRLMALTHGESCMAIHTANPDLPDPRYAHMQQPLSMPASPTSYSPPQTPGAQPVTLERPQTVAYALCDSPTGLMAHVYDAISPSCPGENNNNNSPISTKSSSGGGGGDEDFHDTPCWTPTTLIDWCMLYWLPGPEVALRWLMNSAPMIPKLWRSHCPVPLAISHFSDPHNTSGGTQWAESYHHIALISRRSAVVVGGGGGGSRGARGTGNASSQVRFAAWERPAEMVADIRALACYIAPVFWGGFSPLPSPGARQQQQIVVPSNMPPPPTTMGSMGRVGGGY